MHFQIVLNLMFLAVTALAVPLKIESAVVEARQCIDPFAPECIPP